MHFSINDGKNENWLQTFKLMIEIECEAKMTKEICEGAISNSNKAFQIFVGLTASLSTLSTGLVLAWTSQIGEDLLSGALGFSLTEDELGWISSAVPLGAAFLSLFIASIANKFGRKTTMLAMVLPMELGWLLIIFSQQFWMLFIGRLLTGMIGGAYCAIVPLYVVEISQQEIRGSVGCFTQLMISFGVLLANVFSTFISIRSFSIFCAMFPIMFGAIFLFMPKSPIFLIINGKILEAKGNLIKLHGSDDHLERYIEMAKNKNPPVFQSVRESFQKKSSTKAWYIAIAIIVLKAACAIDPITAYLATFFVSSNIQPKYESIIFASIQLIATIIQVLIVERCGRKILLIISELIMTVCLFAEALALYFEANDTVGDLVAYIPIISLSVFVAAFSMGIGPISWMICAEIFPTDVKSHAMAFCGFLSWILGFCNIKAYSIIQTTGNGQYAFLFYAIVGVFGTLFIVIFVPETKNKSYEEIEEKLSR